MEAQDQWKRERWFLIKLAAPTMLMAASQQAMTFTDQIFLGGLGVEEMAAAALGNTYASFLQFFLFGTATALDTLGATAFGAQKNGLPGTSLVTWCFTSLIVLSTLCIPTMVGLTLARPVASNLLGQNSEISDLVSVFCTGLVPGIPAMMWSIVLMKYLQVQNVVLAPALCTLVTFLSNIGLNFVFIAQLGFQGAPLATSFSRALQCFLMSLLVYGFQHHTRSPQPSKGLLAWLFSDAEACEQLGTLRVVEVESEGEERKTHSCCYHHQHRKVHHKVHLPAEAVKLEPERDVEEAIAIHAMQQQQEQQQLLSRSQENGHPSLVLNDRHDKQGPGEVTVGYGTPSGNKLIPGLRSGIHRFCSELASASQPSLLWTYLRLGLPGGLMMTFEQSSFGISTAIAGRLGPVMVAAHSAFLNVTGMSFVACPFAIGIAASIRVGNLLGAGQPSAACLFAWMCMAVGGTFVVLNSCVILVARNHIGQAFSNDEDVIKIMALIAPIAALHQVSDGLMGTAQGVLRGCGKQTLLMLYNLGGFWGCGVLLGAFLCFKVDMGVTGLWCGIASGTTATAILNVTSLCLVSWPKESQKAQGVLARAAGLPVADHVDEETESLMSSERRDRRVGRQVVAPSYASKEESVRRARRMDFWMSGSDPLTAGKRLLSISCGQKDLKQGR